MEEFELYNAPQSICSHKVRFALNAKGIRFKEYKLDLFSGDQLKPEYLSINPNGLVPTLVHNGFNIIETGCFYFSTSINKFSLERTNIQSL